MGPLIFTAGTQLGSAPARSAPFKILSAAERDLVRHDDVTFGEERERPRVEEQSPQAPDEFVR